MTAGTMGVGGVNVAVDAITGDERGKCLPLLDLMDQEESTDCRLNAFPPDAGALPLGSIGGLGMGFEVTQDHGKMI